MEIPLGLSYDDVLLVPKHSHVSSRKETSLVTQLTKSIQLNAPLVSANMDTVTESKMAIAMARYGGIGIIHRNCGIERQVEEVKKVKTAEEGLIREPYALFPFDSVSSARELISAKDCLFLLRNTKSQARTTPKRSANI